MTLSAIDDAELRQRLRADVTVGWQSLTELIGLERSDCSRPHDAIDGQARAQLRIQSRLYGRDGRRSVGRSAS